MNIQAIQSLVTGIVGKTVEPRRPHKFWVPYAWAVRVLVEDEKLSVSKATEVVLLNSEEEVTPNNLACLRVVYYKIREREWPEGIREKAAVLVTEETITGIPCEPSAGWGSVVTESPCVVVPEEEQTAPESPSEEPDDTEREYTPTVIDPTEEADEGYLPDREEFEV